MKTSSKPRLLLIEDNDDDAERAISSLSEAGEEFDYVRAKSLAEGLWQLEASPPGTYQKIYVNLGLKEIKNKVNFVLQTLSRFVGENNVIAVSSSGDASLPQAVHKQGAKFLYKNEVTDTNGLAIFMFGLQQLAQQQHERSVIRNREMSDTLSKIAILEADFQHKISQVSLRADSLEAKLEEDIGEMLTSIKELRDEDVFLKDRMNAIETMLANANNLAIKKLEVRWQLVVTLIAATCGIVGTIAAAIIPYLIRK